MPELRFPLEQVAALMKHANAAPRHRESYGNTEQPIAALWLVGDQGVYLMSNGLPILPSNKEGSKGSTILYADGCNPDVDDFDTWWANKNATFGADDGVDSIPVSPDEYMDGLISRGFTAVIIHLSQASLTVEFIVEQ